MFEDKEDFELVRCVLPSVLTRVLSKGWLRVLEKVYIVVQKNSCVVMCG